MLPSWAADQGSAFAPLMVKVRILRRDKTAPTSKAPRRGSIDKNQIISTRVERDSRLFRVHLPPVSFAVPFPVVKLRELGEGGELILDKPAKEASVTPCPWKARKNQPINKSHPLLPESLRADKKASSRFQSSYRHERPSRQQLPTVTTTTRRGQNSEYFIQIRKNSEQWLLGLNFLCVSKWGQRRQTEAPAVEFYTF